MNIYEFGIENQMKLLFFQGSCTCWKDYMPSIELLSKEFHVIVPALEGHDPAEPHVQVIDGNAILLRLSQKNARKRDIHWVSNYINGVELHEIPDMEHGELVMVHPKQFYETITDFLNRAKG